MLKRTLLACALLLAAATSVLPAAAASAPSASTGPVTSIGPTTATVSGSVNPNGAATSWYVEYGTSTSYGSKTASTSAGSGTSSVSISPTLTGLDPGTSYHYRVVATSSAGTGRGADGLLTTSAAPQVVTGSASSVTTSSATLNGTVNPSSRSDELVLRVRHQHELRHEDVDEERRLGHERGRRLRAAVRVEQRPYLPFPARRDERRGHEPRQRRRRSSPPRDLRPPRRPHRA